ncbi:hypothetical protein CC79DRAFT_1315579 [Sarocladium strictum]
MKSVATLLGGPALVAAHGLITSPETRTPGAATASICSQLMVDHYVADNTSYPEFLLRQHPKEELIADGYQPELCNFWLCKGFQFEDNVSQVKEYVPGDVIDMEAFIRIPHLGYANVSVVDTASNTIVGEPLLEWAEYADGALFPDLPANQTSFSVTVPELDNKCTTAGECVIQWYWLGQGQTYESCIDFTVPETPSNRTTHSKTI